MRVPLPFPRCDSYGLDGEQAIHRDCGGKLYISPYTSIIHCSKCGHD